MLDIRCAPETIVSPKSANAKYFTKVSGKQTFSRSTAYINRGAISLSRKLAIPQPMRVT